MNLEIALKKLKRWIRISEWIIQNEIYNKIKKHGVKKKEKKRENKCQTFIEVKISNKNINESLKENGLTYTLLDNILIRFVIVENYSVIKYFIFSSITYYFL